MLPQLFFALVVMLVFVAPATSWAGDPLLSGYGGPGTGQQVLLGSHLLGKRGGGSGGSSLRAAAPAASVPASVPAASGAGGGKASHRRSASKHRSHAHLGGTSSASAGTRTAVPRPVAYPARTGDDGGFPFSAGEVVAALLALLAVAGIGVWMRRVTAHGGGPGAQAPS